MFATVTPHNLLFPRNAKSILI